MKYRFNSNIQCTNCKSKVAPILDASDEIQAWEVDLEDPNRSLVVESESLRPEDIAALVRMSGFRAEYVEEA